MKFVYQVISSCVLLAAATQGSAQLDVGLSPVRKGVAIASESQRRDDGFGDTTVELTMTLTNSDRDRERIRKLTWSTRESDETDRGELSLTVFHEPRDVEGTAFLSHTYIKRDDSQWLYLPALKRVKRIASSNKSSPFMGSEFSYEDLLSDEVEKFDYVWLRDEPCGEWSCFVIQRTPRYKNSGYSRQVMWIDHEMYRPVRIDYYDTKQRLLKSLAFEDYRLYLGRFWRAHLLRMENLQSQKVTELSFSKYVFQSGLVEMDFDPGVLQRLR